MFVLDCFKYLHHQVSGINALLRSPNDRKLFTFRDPNTIFRGNSLTSKCIDETMKLAGMHYLQVTLKPIIDEVRSTSKHWHLWCLKSFESTVCDFLLFWGYLSILKRKDVVRNLRSVCFSNESAVSLGCRAFVWNKESGLLGGGPPPLERNTSGDSTGPLDGNL